MHILNLWADQRYYLKKQKEKFMWQVMFGKPAEIKTEKNKKTKSIAEAKCTTRFYSKVELIEQVVFLGTIS